MLIYENRKQKILLTGLHLQNNFNRRFSTHFTITSVPKFEKKNFKKDSHVHIQT